MTAVKDLIDAIHSGDSQDIQTTFETIVGEKVADRLDTFRKETAANLFTGQEAE